MKYVIRFSPLASQQIAQAFEYIRSRHAPANASRWLEGMIQAIEGLALHPQAHALARENDHFEQELRQLVFKSHRVVFEIKGKEVRIHQVIHVARQRMALDEELNDEGL